MLANRPWREALRDPHTRQAVAVATVSILMGAAIGIYVLESRGLRNTSTTMLWFGTAATLVGMLIIWLLDRRRYGWMWAAVLIVQPAAFLGFLEMLRRYPPVPPMG